LPGYVVETDIGARSREGVLGYFENAFAIALRVGARLAGRWCRRGFGSFSGHTKNLQPEDLSGYLLYNGDILRFTRDRRQAAISARHDWAIKF